MVDFGAGAASGARACETSDEHSRIAGAAQGDEGDQVAGLGWDDYACAAPLPRTRIAFLAIVVQNQSSVARLNEFLHEYRDVIIGRMGVPCRERNIAVMSVALEATEDAISALAGKIGMLDGVSSKTVYPKTS